MENNTILHVITNIRPARKPGVYLISYDGDTDLACPDEVVVRWHLQKDKQIPDTELQQIIAEAGEVLAKRTALDLVARGSLSSKELETKLRRAGYSSEARLKAIERMCELHYVDDTAYAHNLVGTLERRGNLGTRRIREELLRRGVQRDLVDQSIANIDAEHERSNALALTIKRWRPVPPDQQAAAIKRLAAYLQRRGFDFPTIRWCLEQVVPEVDINTD